MKYFSFKKLNKRRKIDFIVFLICGSLLLFIGIFTLNFWQALCGFIALIECLDIFNDQHNDDIIERYEKMVGNLINSHHNLLRIIKEIIKKQKEENNESN